MMHTTQNTNIDNILRNFICLLMNEKNTDKNCVLLTTGSFNPIHRSHIENLRKVKACLEGPSYSMNVLAAYISPTHEAYVRGKLGAKDYISSEQRCRLCEDAIREEKLEHFITVSRGECEWPSGFVDFDEVTRQLAEFLNSPKTDDQLSSIQPITVVYVCGLDHFNKCSYVADLAREENIACAIIYRQGASDQYIRNLPQRSQNIFYISLDENRSTLVDISSTAIREHHRNRNYAELDRLSYPSVSQYYRNSTQ